MAEKKSITEEVMLDIKKIQEALNANTKEILRSVAKEEINGLVKESLKEDDYEEEDAENDTEETSDDDATAEPAGDDSEETPAEPVGDDSVEIGGPESDDSDIQTSDEVGIGDDQESGMDADALGGDELDMTGASDDDVIAIYRKLSGDDEIEVVGDEIHMNITQPGEYIVKKGALDGGMGADTMGDEPIGGELGGEIGAGIGDDMGGEEIGADSMDDDMTYEISMDDDDSEGEIPQGPEAGEEEDENQLYEATEETEEDEEIVKEEDETEEDEAAIEEKIQVGKGRNVTTNKTSIVGAGGKANHVKAPNVTVTSESKAAKNVISESEIKYKKLLSEATQLKNENEEFRQALKKFRGMLVETVVFNSNLSYVTKLFMEHSTTKDEKIKIIQRFDDEVTNLKESKRLYKSIANDLSSRKPINESIENKLIKEVSTGASKQLNEATAYVDPSTQRIKDLINRVENKDKY